MVCGESRHITRMPADNKISNDLDMIRHGVNDLYLEQAVRCAVCAIQYNFIKIFKDVSCEFDELRVDTHASCVVGTCIILYE